MYSKGVQFGRFLFDLTFIVKYIIYYYKNKKQKLWVMNNVFRKIVGVVLVITFITCCIFIGGGVIELMNTPNHVITDKSGVLLFIGIMGVVASVVLFFLNKKDAESDQIY